MLKQGLFLYEEWKNLTSKLNSDYLAKLNKRLISENDQLKSMKEQSGQIIDNLKQDLQQSQKLVDELTEKLASANSNLPHGDTDRHRRRSQDRATSASRKLQFELGQKEEALIFKDKSLKTAEADIKQLRTSVVELKNSINMYEEKNLSLQSQLRAKNDLIKKLENKLKAFVDTKQVSVNLNIQSMDNDKLKMLNQMSTFEGSRYFNIL